MKAFSFDDAVNGATAVTKSFTPTEKANAEYQYQEGVNGKAITLNGTYGLKLCPGEALGNSYTISYWMKPEKVGGGVDPTLAACSCFH